MAKFGAKDARLLSIEEMDEIILEATGLDIVNGEDPAEIDARFVVKSVVRAMNEIPPLVGEDLGRSNAVTLTYLGYCAGMLRHLQIVYEKRLERIGPSYKKEYDLAMDMIRASMEMGAMHAVLSHRLEKAEQ